MAEIKNKPMRNDGKKYPKPPYNQWSLPDPDRFRETMARDLERNIERMNYLLKK